MVVKITDYDIKNDVFDRQAILNMCMVYYYRKINFNVSFIQIVFYNNPSTPGDVIVNIMLIGC